MNENLSHFFNASVHLFDTILEQVAKDERFIETRLSPNRVRYDLRRDIAQSLGLEGISMLKYEHARAVTIANTNAVEETSELYHKHNRAKYELHNSSDQPVVVESLPFVRYFRQDFPRTQTLKLEPFVRMLTYQQDMVNEMVRRTKAILYPVQEPQS